MVIIKKTQIRIWNRWDDSLSLYKAMRMQAWKCLASIESVEKIHLPRHVIPRIFIGFFDFEDATFRNGFVNK